MPLIAKFVDTTKSCTREGPCDVEAARLARYRRRTYGSHHVEAGHSPAGSIDPVMAAMREVAAKLVAAMAYYACACLVVLALALNLVWFFGPIAVLVYAAVSGVRARDTPRAVACSLFLVLLIILTVRCQCPTSPRRRLLRALRRGLACGGAPGAAPPPSMAVPGGRERPAMHALPREPPARRAGAGGEELMVPSYGHAGGEVECAV
ncbi:hypothetical protein ACP4OV_009195 [Aristida adscensionis]